MRQIFTENELNALLDMITIREMSAPVREAVRLRIICGYSFELAAVMIGVSKTSVINAVKRIVELEVGIQKFIAVSKHGHVIMTFLIIFFANLGIFYANFS